MVTKAQINAAKKLLEKEGFTVTKTKPGYEVIQKRTDPRIGDVVRFHMDMNCDVLVTFHQTDDASTDDVYSFGGVVVSEQNYNDMHTEHFWIDRNEWAKDDGKYEVIGHVDLDKWIKR